MSTVEQSVLSFRPSAEPLLRVVQLLQGIVDAANHTDDLSSIKQKLADCVAVILEEVEPRTEAAPRPFDPVTLLPPRNHAEAAILKAIESETPCCAAVVVLDCLASVNLKFGHNVGDEILRYYADTLRRHLPIGDRVFRWSGPALLVLRPRPSRIELVRREFGRLLESRYEKTIQTASRVVHLPIQPRWTIWTIAEQPRLLFRKIDSFVSILSRQESV